jgi:3-isopropylmalate/(R)-2-methylmalate dehydratase small subunit
MSGWTTHHEGAAVALAARQRRHRPADPGAVHVHAAGEGYGRFLLHDMRRDADGKLRGFPAEPCIRSLGAGRAAQFRRCGSSREAAVYALVDFGIRAVIAPSFGDIFAANAVNNGLLPRGCLRGRHRGSARPRHLGGTAVTVDLEDLDPARSARRPDLPFALDPVWRTKLINGWDDIDLTAQHAEIHSPLPTNRHGHRPVLGLRAGLK